MMKKNPIKLPDFEKMELRVGTVKEAFPVEGSDKLLRLGVLLEKCDNPSSGKSGRKVIRLSAGIAKEYNPDYIIGKQVVVLVNLEPKKIMGENSEGMILAADADGTPILISPEKQVPNGSVVR